MTAAHTLTVLHAHGRRLAKLVRADGSTVGYNLARTVDAAVVTVPTRDALHRLLLRLLPRPDCCAIRGAPLAGDRATGIRRLLHPDPDTGDAATFRDVPRAWVALDVEGIVRPACLAAADLIGCARLALDALPAAFAGCAGIVQATAGHGLKPDMRLRLWFTLDRPAWGHELRRWLRGTPADPSVFRAVQPIYTAAPVFDGCPDHLPTRMAVLPGRDMVPVPAPDTLAPPPPPAQPMVLRPVQAGRYGRAALERAAGRIASAGEGQRHPSLVAEARSLARLVRAGLLAEGDVRAVLAAAARHAGKADAAEIASCIAWGLSRPSSAPVPELRR